MFHFKRSLVTRGYELDARGHIPPAAIARYFEHARWQAVGAPEFGLVGLMTRGYKTVLRAQQIDLLEPLTQGVELAVTMFLAHVGRTSLRFVHRLVRVSDQRPVALGLVAAVLLDRSGKPAELPERMHSLVQKGELPQTPPAAEEKAPAEAVALPVQVRPSDLDLLEHVNQARYVEYCDDARQVAALAGAYGAASQGAAGRVTGLAVEYLRETRLGTELLCQTWAHDEAGQSLGFALRQGQAGPVAARAQLLLEPL